MEAMTEDLPFSHFYNLARLGNAGDEVHFAADAAAREAIAAWSGVVSLERLEARVKIAKLGASRFGLDFTLDADVTQACVVTLEPVPAHIAHAFDRELQFLGPTRHRPAEDESAPEVVLDLTKEEGPEAIESLHYDLAGPVLEEYVLSLEPYPRSPGVEFAPPPEASQGPESPFAVLKGLK
jgi:uncharacterized metal-binding protein YceD (DUF177 family)